MSRRLVIRAISFIAVALILSFAINIKNMRRIKRYEQVISENYNLAFSEIVAGMTKIDYALEKCAYSGDSSLVASLCGEVFCQAEGASHALSRLPLQELSLESTTEFISRTGDFAYYILKKAARGEEITDSELKSLKRLSEGASDIVVELHRISNRLEKDSLDLSRVDFKNYEDRTIADIRELEREFSEYPVLVYDGPFSEETKGRKEYYDSLPEAAESDMYKTIARFFGEKRFEKSGEWEDDGIKLHTFTDGEVYIDVAEKGALVYKCISQKPLGERKLTAEEGLLKGKEALERSGFSGLKETYHMCYDNLLIINYAGEKNGTTVYPDLVKVSISLSDGSIVGFDAAGYIKNHSEREIRDIATGEKEARKRVSKNLKVLSYSPAIIPRDGAGEVLAHEFVCETENGEHCLVYINPETLKEERILILIEDENGTLAI